MAIFSLQAQPTDGPGWLDLARRAEAAGYHALLAADHPGAVASPFVALAAAAAVTSTIGLGSYVSNAGIREPMLLASDVATLDVLSGGRARLGIGAGHTPVEWRAVGRERPDVAGRVRRCVAVAEAVRALLDGEEVTVDTPELAMRAARLDNPRPVQRRVPLTFGGANSTLLRWAGAHADVVGLAGLGRTLPDGHQHEVRWRAAEIEHQLECVAAGAAGRAEPPVLEALVQQVAVTDDAEAAAAQTAAETGLTVAELLATPFVLIGTEDEIVAAVAEHRRRWGVTRFVVRADALEPLTPVLARLAHTG
ncbi:TIGR03621 family F420-dependent LLM class oxidoreductase [Micromonospora sp. C28SCA-DRY-2]|uniref:TIGR03621 family F420-dependent LLM class oxidoreductase n=1 Tax=Micromonospora sp. C28SCA-DRY-2 TaxID=3059522 RepID=UPI002675D530|nr:TIGR03621 family F420-dependent LLM class oxidoreductase [Micromonospora sp. C28SCA-DRY-2]MDO3706061.1 TIGR03621 family F420-dependent LLM class oxidoreductase [Micromonospora sp. C28SCA-DRY-2]